MSCFFIENILNIIMFHHYVFFIKKFLKHKNVFTTMISAGFCIFRHFLIIPSECFFLLFFVIQMYRVSLYNPIFKQNVT